MKNAMKYWWLILLKGIILILLSIYVFGHPVGALLGLAVYLGTALLLTGIFLIAAALSTRDTDDQWGWRLTEGILDVIFAIILLANPAVTATVFPFVVGFWMIFYGIMIFTGSFGLKKSGEGTWWLNLIVGILTVFMGYVIMSDFLAGTAAITFWIGTGILLFGIVNVVIALNLRKVNKALT